MNETHAQRRARILAASPECSPLDYDSAIALGYEPESYEGMWKLPTNGPILWITHNWAIVREVVYQPGTYRAVLTRKGTAKTRYHLKRALT